jgi:predicted RNA-binding Zn-ribbon protein involved in translation (DUF1610 family)
MTKCTKSNCGIESELNLHNCPVCGYTMISEQQESNESIPTTYKNPNLDLYRSNKQIDAIYDTFDGVYLNG